MSKTPDERALWEAIKRNPRLANLVTHLLRSDEAQELLAAAAESEREE